MVGNSTSGTIFDLRKYSIHDGPGIRTTLFFKGCPLSCWWCHNPEGRFRQSDLFLRLTRCIRCEACVAACRENAIHMDDQGPVTDRERCNLCGDCIEPCYAQAREMTGRQVTVNEILQEVERDIPFYEQSGGGVTFSGGEPLLQPEFLLELLKECRTRDIHTTVDTSGYASWKTFARILPFTCLFLYDLKMMSDKQHQKYTGVSNRVVLANLVKLSGQGIPLIIRMPLIPGINDGEQNLRQMACFLADQVKPRFLELLPYHDTARTKYESLGTEYLLNDTPLPTADDIKKAADLIRAYGIDVLGD